MFGVSLEDNTQILARRPCAFNFALKLEMSIPAHRASRLIGSGWLCLCKRVVDDFDIYVKHGNTSAPIRLTSSPEPDLSPLRLPSEIAGLFESHRRRYADVLVISEGKQAASRASIFPSCRETRIASFCLGPSKPQSTGSNADLHV
jgi:hypothetical protein